MLFSVVIPVFNADKTLERCITSVLCQNFSDYEIILVDDGSTDKSKLICDAYAANNTNIKYLYTKNNGVSAARNFGMKNASGEYIVFLDSDDRYLPDYLGEFSYLIERCPDSNNYWCGYEMCLPDNRVTEYKFNSPERCVVESRNNIMNLYNSLLLNPSWNKVYNRHLIIKNHILFDESLSLGEDLLFNFQYLNYSGTEIVINNQAEYQYIRENRETLNTIYRADLKDCYDTIFDEVGGYIYRWDLASDQVAKYHDMVYNLSISVMYNTFRKNNPLSYWQKIRYNTAVMKSHRFRNAIQKASTGTVNKLYKFGFLYSNYAFIRLLDRIRSLLKK